MNFREQLIVEHGVSKAEWLIDAANSVLSGLWYKPWPWLDEWKENGTKEEKIREIACEILEQERLGKPDGAAARAAYGQLLKRLGAEYRQHTDRDGNLIRHLPLDTKLDSDEPSAEDEYFASQERDNYQTLIRLFAEHLTDKQLEALIFAASDISIAEAARLTGVSDVAMRDRLYQARQKLQPLASAFTG